MQDFYKTSLQFQKTLIEATAAATRMMSENYLRLLEQQSALFTQASTYRRADEDVAIETKDGPVNPVARKRKPGKRPGHKTVSPCCGADLNDHYGKRARDVDVNRI